ncbi:MAG: hypothetical protein KJ906_03260 [Nanoarchaeota archaeon]|nr:hypothetical protein [Nanoarchaeota archaeon]
MKIKFEELSYKTIVGSAVMIFVGLLLGSYVKYTVLLAEVGAFILLLGIIFYIISQMVE